MYRWHDMPWSKYQYSKYFRRMEIHTTFTTRLRKIHLLTFESVLCKPMARPSNIEWTERERKSMKERKGEWAWKSTWTCWLLLSASGSAGWLCICPWPFLLSCIRGALSSCAPLMPPQFRTILSTMRTAKKPVAKINSGRGKLVYMGTKKGTWLQTFWVMSWP